MRQREESKRSSRSLEDLSATELQEVMQRMEHKIHKIAQKELAYLNQSKKLREARTIMTSRHQRLAQTLQQALRAKDPSATVDAPRLPPVLSTGSSGNPALIDLTE
jgi:tRNA isopentenyl-2-thiomethyl-A-37 hydroxylase MiaE